jgi:hypothetical protein
VEGRLGEGIPRGDKEPDGQQPGDLSAPCPHPVQPHQLLQLIHIRSLLTHCVLLPMQISEGSQTHLSPCHCAGCCSPALAVSLAELTRVSLADLYVVSFAEPGAVSLADLGAVSLADLVAVSFGELTAVI